MGAVRGEAEVVLAFPDPIPAARHVRSTLLVASVENVRHLGHLDAYLTHLPREHHATLLEAIAATWLPMEVAHAHYTALETLGLAPSVQISMGRRSIERIGGTLIGTSIAMAKQAGATPWTILPRIQRFWHRGYDGGGLAVWKLGPKEARLDLAEFRLCEIPFYRNALSGWVASLLETVCEKCYVAARGSPRGPHSFSVRAQWV
jgi:hypothetical protein